MGITYQRGPPTCCSSTHPIEQHVDHYIASLSRLRLLRVGVTSSVLICRGGSPSTISHGLLRSRIIFRVLLVVACGIFLLSMWRRSRYTSSSALGHFVTSKTSSMANIPHCNTPISLSLELFTSSPSSSLLSFSFHWPTAATPRPSPMRASTSPIVFFLRPVVDFRFCLFLSFEMLPVPSRQDNCL